MSGLDASTLPASAPEPLAERLALLDPARRDEIERQIVEQLAAERERRAQLRRLFWSGTA